MPNVSDISVGRMKYSELDCPLEGGARSGKYRGVGRAWAGRVLYVARRAVPESRAHYRPRVQTVQTDSLHILSTLSSNAGGAAPRPVRSANSHHNGGAALWLRCVGQLATFLASGGLPRIAGCRHHPPPSPTLVTTLTKSSRVAGSPANGSAGFTPFLLFHLAPAQPEPSSALALLHPHPVPAVLALCWLSARALPAGSRKARCTVPGRAAAGLRSEGEDRSETPRHARTTPAHPSLPRRTARWRPMAAAQQRAAFALEVASMSTKANSGAGRASASRLVATGGTGVFPSRPHAGVATCRVPRVTHHHYLPLHFSSVSPSGVGCRSCIRVASSARTSTPDVTGSGRVC